MENFIINLASDKARWDSVSRHFSEAGLSFRRIEAVMGKALSAEETNRIYSPRLNSRQYYKPLLPGEIGCYASHLEAWRELLRSGERCVAIFEDDVELAPDLPEVLAAIERLDADWDMVKLIGLSEKRPQWRRPLLPGRDLVGFRRVPSLTGAYVVSRSGAAKLLERRIPFGRPIDVDLRYWWECDLRILGIYPYPVNLADISHVSSIHGAEQQRLRTNRFRKALLKLEYSVRNLIANRTRRADPHLPRLGRNEK